MTPGFAVTRDGAIETVTLDRVGRLNALDLATIDALTAYFKGLLARPEVRCVLLRGAGRGFCAGLDLADWHDMLAHATPAAMVGVQTRAAGLIRAMRAAPPPIVGLAHGVAAGLGFALLLACDLRIGAVGLAMNVASVRIGLSGADVGISFLLPRIVGEGRAADLMLTGRVIGAEEAMAIGLLGDIVADRDLHDRGLRAASDIARNAPLGVRMTKSALAAAAPTLETAMAIEDRQQVLLINTADHREAVAAFIAKRPPVFTGA
ncbi:enoyl-CoA hydratase/isomerase family protein [Hephaestia sp. GCM10023244]|uniref:enoyl-CoA hydratase/isomerase family protein n=1 Tax=unclassified Hephaestia TaxID=2631281 RepID=UPI00207757DD|nr:enoyl-CoA hydratase-related protein [Hephaestia sp. MAHUQ-44]MCM8729815.1 enoyl-CoA hydratase-related protein [Hephaestia sp. MAHUQ-44]